MNNQYKSATIRLPQESYDYLKTTSKLHNRSMGAHGGLLIQVASILQAEHNNIFTEIVNSLTTDQELKLLNRKGRRSK